MTRDVLVDGFTALVARQERTGITAGEDGGLYHRDTRHLSELAMTFEGAALATVGRDLLASNRRQVVAAGADSAVNRVDTLEHKRTDLVVHVEQSVTEADGLTQRVTVTNHSASHRSERLVVSVAADFADVFEIRGFASQLDRDVSTTVGDRTIEFDYEYDAADGSDSRTTTVTFDPAPAECTSGRATFDLDLDPQSTSTVEIRATPGVEHGGPDAATDPSLAVDSRPDPYAVDIDAIRAERPDHGRVIERAGADLAALTTATEYGLVPLAGVPWFGTVFGRDALLAAYQALPVAPALARGTLRYLAAHRGQTTDDEREEAPGKVFHEIRTGELARRGLIPHTPYYGSIDATPLWVLVLAETWRFTGDDTLVEALAEPLAEALDWTEDTRSNHGADPFLYYEASPTTGMEHKAWRDTPGSVQYPDGQEAEPPIASVEVQGYVYRALSDAAVLYDDVLGDADRANTLRERAEELADAFQTEFWIPETEYYAAAKAGDGRLVPTRTSNVGHCLLSGIVSERRASSVAATLRSPDVFTGWGLRTMATTAAGYSPLSYHLGSVWPHDTALAALGLARYGFHDDAERLARGIVDSATYLADGRIPELFCGLDDDSGPKPYPASCVPQAWSAAAPFALLRATFDLSPDETGVTANRSPSLFADSAVDPIRDYWNHE